MVELRCSSRERPQIALLASCRRGARAARSTGSSAVCTTACARARASSWKSTSCHRVSVPPQSKITASTVTRANLTGTFLDQRSGLVDVEAHEPAEEVDERTEGQHDGDGADADGGAEQVPPERPTTLDQAVAPLEGDGWVPGQ